MDGRPAPSTRVPESACLYAMVSISTPTCTHRSRTSSSRSSAAGSLDGLNEKPGMPEGFSLDTKKYDHYIVRAQCQGASSTGGGKEGTPCAFARACGSWPKNTTEKFRF